MRRTFLLAAAAALAAAALIGSGTAGAVTHPRLLGTVGKGGAFKITLTNAQGKPVKTLKAGTYTLVIHDGSGDSQLRARRSARQVVDVHDSVIRRDEDQDADAGARQVQGLLRAARVDDVPALHGRHLVTAEREPCAVGARGSDGGESSQSYRSAWMRRSCSSIR